MLQNYALGHKYGLSKCVSRGCFRWDGRGPHLPYLRQMGKTVEKSERAPLLWLCEGDGCCWFDPLEIVLQRIFGILRYIRISQRDFVPPQFPCPARLRPREVSYIISNWRLKSIVTYFYEKPTNTYFVLDLLYKSVAPRTTISKMGSSHPDADLYPRATGAAARLVEAH
jgi:hypothetical protein